MILIRPGYLEECYSAITPESCTCPGDEEMCLFLSALWMEMGAPSGREQLDRNAYRIEFLYIIVGFMVMDTLT